MEKGFIIKITAALLLSCLWFCGCNSKSESKSESNIIARQHNNSTDLQNIIEIEPISDKEIVCVSDYITNIQIDLKYAENDNFTGQTIYSFHGAYLRLGTVKKLAEVQNRLNKMGYSLLIWDAFRPQSAQYELWKVYPDGNYVANPYKKHSSHSNGGTVDITLVRLSGEEVPMPSDFDVFNEFADRDYRDVGQCEAKNARLLENTMKAAGFVPYSKEWWHFSDSEDYEFEDVENINLPSFCGCMYSAKCDEYINLRQKPQASAEVIYKIPSGDLMHPLAWIEGFVRVEYNGLQGYVSSEYIDECI